jgi:hypothetical protein
MLGKQLRRPKTVDSPKSKTRQLLRYFPGRDDNGVRKTLIFHDAIVFLAFLPSFVQFLVFSLR